MIYLHGFLIQASWNSLNTRTKTLLWPALLTFPQKYEHSIWTLQTVSMQREGHGWCKEKKSMHKLWENVTKYSIKETLHFSLPQFEKEHGLNLNQSSTRWSPCHFVSVWTLTIVRPFHFEKKITKIKGLLGSPHKTHVYVLKNHTVLSNTNHKQAIYSHLKYKRNVISASSHPLN